MLLLVESPLFHFFSLRLAFSGAAPADWGAIYIAWLRRALAYVFVFDYFLRETGFPSLFLRAT